MKEKSFIYIQINKYTYNHKGNILEGKKERKFNGIWGKTKVVISAGLLLEEFFKFWIDPNYQVNFHFLYRNIFTCKLIEIFLCFAEKNFSFFSYRKEIFISIFESVGECEVIGKLFFSRGFSFVYMGKFYFFLILDISCRFCWWMRIWSWMNGFCWSFWKFSFWRKLMRGLAWYWTEFFLQIFISIICLRIEIWMIFLSLLFQEGYLDNLESCLGFIVEWLWFAFRMSLRSSKRIFYEKFEE